MLTTKYPLWFLTVFSAYSKAPFALPLPQYLVVQCRDQLDLKYCSKSTSFSVSTGTAIQFEDNKFHCHHNHYIYPP